MWWEKRCPPTATFLQYWKCVPCFQITRWCERERERESSEVRCAPFYGKNEARKMTLKQSEWERLRAIKRTTTALIRRRWGNRWDDLDLVNFCQRRKRSWRGKWKTGFVLSVERSDIFARVCFCESFPPVSQFFLFSLKINNNHNKV